MILNNIGSNIIILLITLKEVISNMKTSIAEE
jgi:hypothetical protein